MRLFWSLILGAMLAQELQPPTGYELEVFGPGADAQTATPIQITTIPMTAVTCGQPITPPYVGVVTNPRFLTFNDTMAPNKECRVDLSAFVLSLPGQTGYRLSVVALYGTDRSMRSNPTNTFTSRSTSACGVTGTGTQTVTQSIVGGRPLRITVCAETW